MRVTVHARKQIGALNFANRLFSTKPFKFDYDIKHLYDTNYNNVPVLPLPKLEDTLNSYLRAIRPMATEQEFGKTKVLADQFKSGPGKDLHQLLSQNNAETALKSKYPFSYIEKYWDEMYLGGRWSIPINSNPFYLLENNHKFTSPLNRAAQFINATTKFWLKTRNGLLEADVEVNKKANSATPLCMYQFSNVLGCARIPGKKRDHHELHPFSDHIIVAYRSRYFKVPVIKNNRPIDVASLEKMFQAVKAQWTADAPKMGSDFADVGAITTAERGAVFDLRAEMSLDPTNVKCFDEIDRSLFVFTIDDSTTTDVNELSKLGLTGIDGTSRWFDKHSVIIDGNGELFVNFEHSSGDGLTWNRWTVEAWYNMHGLIDDTYPYAPFEHNDIKFETAPAALNFQLTGKSSETLCNFTNAHRNNIANVDHSILEFEAYGKKTTKKWNVSPDAVAQMAMQVAYHKTHRPALGVPVYEACAMKSYFHGRTETIRSCTSESTDMSKMFLDPSISNDEKRNAFIQACNTHVEVAKGAKNCKGPYQGVDRHLFALKCLAMETGKGKIDFFEDPVYSRSSNWLLSTSNVTTPFFRLFGFGPVTTKGYGLGYQTFDGAFPFAITSFKSENSASDYAKNLAESFHAIQKVFQQ